MSVNCPFLRVPAAARPVVALPLVAGLQGVLAAPEERLDVEGPGPAHPRRVAEVVVDHVSRVPVWESTSECRIDGVGRLKFDFHTARNGWKRIDRSPRRRVIHASTASYVSVGKYLFGNQPVSTPSSCSIIISTQVRREPVCGNLFCARTAKVTIHYVYYTLRRRRRRRPPDLLEALGQPDLPPDRVDPRQRAERDVPLRRARDDARAPAFVGDEGRVPLLL